MLKTFFKITFRNLLRHKGFSSINIAGLAIGMASAVLIILWMVNELSYDGFHRNGKYIYQAWNRGVFDGKLQCWSSTPAVLGPALKEEFPEVENYCREYVRWFVTRVGDTKLSTEALMADPSFLTMFDFRLIKGDPKQALANTYSMVVTESMARKMFGKDEAVGKTIKVNDDVFTVTGLMKDVPVNSNFHFEYILPWAYHIHLEGDNKSWGSNSFGTIVQLKQNADPVALDAKIRDITIRHSDKTQETEVFLHPLSKWHLYSNFENGKQAGGRISIVRMFGIIAGLILLIACINFMNLSTARSEKRAKEVGIRKVSGAHRRLLVMQFISESIIVALLAAVLAAIIVYFALPPFNDLVGQRLVVPYSNPGFWIYALAFIILTGLIAGSYPAFFLSSFRPVSVLKGTFRRAHAAVNPRKVLVVLQFTFALILLISTIVVTQQIRYAQDRDTGYDREKVVYHWITGDLNKNFAVLKNELIRQGVATSVTRTLSPLTFGLSSTWSLQWKGKNDQDKVDMDLYTADESLVQTAGLTLVAGRDMDLTTFPTDSSAMLVNESAVKIMGFANPIGETVREDEREFHIIGVIKDFILGSPFEPNKPMVIEGARASVNVIHVRLSDRRSIAQNLQVMEQLFKQYNPDYPFGYHFVDEDYAVKFSGVQRTASLTAVFTILTILISCLGLFGLAAYMAENRIKEIGVRKVLGASVANITALLSIDFLRLVAISIVVASPIAWLAMNKWLQQYSYRISIQWWVFVLAAGLALLIAFLTVSFQAIRAAIANPIRSLRTE